MLAKGFVEKIEGQLEETEGDYKQGHKDKRLQRAVIGGAFSQVAKFCGPFGAQNEPECGKGEDETENAK